MLTIAFNGCKDKSEPIHSTFTVSGTVLLKGMADTPLQGINIVALQSDGAFSDVEVARARTDLRGNYTLSFEYDVSEHIKLDVEHFSQYHFYVVKDELGKEVRNLDIPQGNTDITRNFELIGNAVLEVEANDHNKYSGYDKGYISTTYFSKNNKSLKFLPHVNFQTTEYFTVYGSITDTIVVDYAVERLNSDNGVYDSVVHRVFHPVFVHRSDSGILKIEL